jgi:hypothetical protein
MACLKRIKEGCMRNGDLELWLEADYLKTTWHLLTSTPGSPVSVTQAAPGSDGLSIRG